MIFHLSNLIGTKKYIFKNCKGNKIGTDSIVFIDDNPQKEPGKFSVTISFSA